MDKAERERLDKLERRIETRREELRRKAQVISIAPAVENRCLCLPV